MKDLLKSKDILFAMAVCTAVAILLKCICAIIYHNLLRDARQIQTTKNKWIRAMITKFEACYKIQISIHNPSCFVSQQLERYRIFKISIHTLENADIFTAFLLLCSSLFMLIQNISCEQSVKRILLQSITPLFFISLLGFSEVLFKIRLKKRRLKLLLLDYLENTIQSKLENQYLYPEMQKAYQNAYFDVTSNMEGQARLDHMVHLEEMTASQKKEKKKNSFPKEMRDLIDSIVQEEKLAKDIQKIQKENTASAATEEKMQLIEEIIKEYL